MVDWIVVNAIITVKNKTDFICSKPFLGDCTSEESLIHLAKAKSNTPYSLHNAVCVLLL